ncbi:MAG: DUF362 domain-containing protein [Terriglobia bacterium]|nr:DUF362 domain-containing protein [Terriglobia bacterium]
MPKQVVAFRSRFAQYPDLPPFHPSERYPEYAFGEFEASANHAYAAVRECFRLAGLDATHFGTPEWNPLGELMHPGETVVLKPNMVKETHPRDPKGWQYVLTHGSVIRAAADYIWKAIGSPGKLYLADAPQTDSSWTGLVRVLGLESIQEFYRRQGFLFELVDLRREEWTSKDDVIVERRRLQGDPNGTAVLDLKDASEFVGHNGTGHYYGADYDSGEVNRHHSGGHHEYMIAGTVIKADVVFSLPKLKTHKKAGITVSLKNLVGVNADKNWLPHHTEGDPKDGGDEHPHPGGKHRLERRTASLLRAIAVRFPGIGPWLWQRARRFGIPIFGDSQKVIRSGNWFGNDTIWRMCLDLNKLVLYGIADGRLREPLPENRKRHYVLVDGIIAGEGRGPLNPDPVPAGTMLFGINPASVDAACAWLMGFDPEKIPIVRRAFQVKQCPLVDHDWRDVELISNVEAWSGPLVDVPDDATFHFEPHFGWKGQVERQPAEVLAR